MFGFNKKNKLLASLRTEDLFILSLRVFRTRFSRTMLTILGMSLGAGVVLFLVSLGYGLQQTLIGKLVTTEDSLISVEAYYAPDSGLQIEENTIEEISREVSVGGISSVAEFPAEIRIAAVSGIMSSSTPYGFLFAKIVDDNYFKFAGVTADSGKTFTEKNEGVLISSAGLKILDIPDGDGLFKQDFAIRILYADKNGDTKISELNGVVKIVGVIQNDSETPFIIVPRGVVKDPAPYYSRIFVRAKDALAIETLRDKLVNMGFLVSTHLDLVNQAKKVMSIVTIVLGVFGIAALFVSAIGMFNTMIISFLERTFEVGIMKAIGATNKDIRNLFLMESFVMGFLGGVGGVLIGVFLGELSNFSLNLLAKNFGGKAISIFVRPLWFEILIICIASVIGVVSGLVPARRAMSISPKEAFIRK